MQNKLNLSTKIERLILVFIVTLLVVIWFQKGLIYGSGESGLPFYNTKKLLEIVQHAWADTPTGASSAVGFASIPFYLILTFLENLNIPSFLIQAVFFWLIFITGVLSIHKLTYLLPQSTTVSRLSSSLFYIFNPVVHVAVLHRFQYPFIFFYGFMPFVFYYYFQGLKKKNFLSLIILNLITVLFSFTFEGLALLELTIGILGLLSFFYFIYLIKKEKKSFFPFFYFTFFLTTFVLLHSWWIFPLYSSLFSDTQKVSALRFFSPSGNVDTFKAISKDLESALSVFRLVPPKFYMTDGSSWGWIYHTLPFLLLSLFPILAFTMSLFRKTKSYLFYFFTTLTLIVMFFMKGELRPFGNVSLTLISKFVFLQVFRNPFEKVSLLLPFAMALPVGVGTAMIVQFLSNKIKFNKFVFTVLFFLIAFPLYMFPIVNGYVFTGGGVPSDNLNIGQLVKVPSYYDDARKWLDKQDGLFRVIALPIDGEGMTYNWEYGYAGVELLNNIFNQPIVSFSTDQDFLTGIVRSLKKSLFINPESFAVLAQILNTRYVLIRNDINYQIRQTKSPSAVLNGLENNLKDHFSLVNSFGQLAFYEINSQDFKPKVYAEDNPTLLSDTESENFDLIPFTNENSRSLLLFSPQISSRDVSQASPSGIVLKGLRVENIKIDPEDSDLGLPFVRFQRSNFLYKILKIKEEIDKKTFQGDKKLVYEVSLLNKRLSEANTFTVDRKAALNDYYDLFESIVGELSTPGFAQTNRDIPFSFLRQRKVLGILKDEDSSVKDKVTQIIGAIDSYLNNVQFRSLFPTENYLIFRFYAPEAGNYEITLGNEEWQKYYQGFNFLKVDLDGKSTILPLRKTNDTLFSFGSYFFGEGNHEISFPYPSVLNLVDVPEEIDLASQKKEEFKQYLSVKNFDHYSQFRISFDYLVEKGNGPVVGIEQDTDPINTNGRRQPSIDRVLSRDDFDYGWRNYSFEFTTDPMAKDVKVYLKIVPWGDCKSVVKRVYIRYCKDSVFNKLYLRDSKAKIKNFKLERVFSNPLVIRKFSGSQDQVSLPQIKFSQINQSQYNVNVTQAKQPFYLVLSTAYNSNWIARFTSDGSDSISDLDHKPANGYANAWYIDRKGDFDLSLEYSPERKYIIGKNLSVAVGAVYLGIVFVKFAYDRYHNFLS